MNADNFARYLRDPSLLYQISYQELKSLALQYPYCQNLHLLMLQKSYMESMPDWKKNLEKAAAYSIDRPLLYHLVKSLSKREQKTEAYLLEEEYLELKSLTTLEREELPVDAGASERDESISLQFQTESPKPNSEEDFREDNFEETLSQVDAEMAPRETEIDAAGQPTALGLTGNEDSQEKALIAPTSPGSSKPFADDEMMDGLAVISSIVSGLAFSSSPAPKPATANKTVFQLPSPELSALRPHATRNRYSSPKIKDTNSVTEKPKPQPKNSFTTWVEQFQSPTVQIRLGELMESKKMDEARRARKKKGRKGSKAKIPRLAVRSITENEEVISETLAELLAAQGSFDKAREMYSRLMLVFPEKSDYFAEKIKNLKSE